MARLVRVGRWIGGALAACSAVALCQSCGGRTSVVVTVATDIADLDFVSIEASGPRGSRPPAPDIEPDAAWVFAREFLATDEMDGETFAFTARGYRDDLVVALQTRSVRIARDQVQTLALHLCDDCGGQDCQGQACLDAGGACTLRGDPAVATWSSEAPAPTCSPSGCEEDEACENAGVSDCGEFVPDAVKGGVCTLPAPACAEGDVAVPGGCLDLSVCISDDEWRARDDALPNRVWVRKGHGGKNYEPNGSYEKPYRNVADAMKDKPNATLFLMRRPADDANGKTYAVSLVTNGIELRGKCPGDVRLEGSVTIGPGVTGATLRSLTLDALDVDSGAAVTVDAVRLGGAGSGDVTISPGARVTITGSHVAGSIDAAGALSLDLQSTRVEGMVEASGTADVPLALGIDHAALGGGLHAADVTLAAADSLLRAPAGRWVADIAGASMVTIERAFFDVATGALGALRLRAAGPVTIQDTTFMLAQARGLDLAGVAGAALLDSYLGGARDVAVRLADSDVTVERVRVERVHAGAGGSGADKPPGDGFAVIGGSTLSMSHTRVIGADRAGLSVFDGDAVVTIAQNAFEHCGTGIVQVGEAAFAVPDTNRCTAGESTDACQPDPQPTASFPPPPAG
ncbi:MAG: hypothetical protein WKG00_00560 [Polyangiaceae bacterium]